MPKVSDDHIAARRRQILDGARTCFAEHGFEGASVRRLEHATGMSRGAIFHHYDNKDALFLALAREDAQSMADTVAERGLVQVMRRLLADPGEYSWLATRLEIARRIRTDPEFRRRWSADQAALDTAVIERLRQQQADGRVRTDLTAAELATYLELVLDGVITHLATGREPGHLSAALDLVEAAVRTA